MIIAKSIDLGADIVTIEYEAKHLEMFINREDCETYKPSVYVTCKNLDTGTHEGELEYNFHKKEFEVVWDKTAPENWEDVEPAAVSLLYDAVAEETHHTVKVVFGAEDTGNFLNGIQVADTNTVKVFEFNSREEAAAFTKGVDAGVGWMQHAIVSEEDEHLIPEKYRTKKEDR